MKYSFCQMPLRVAVAGMIWTPPWHADAEHEPGPLYLPAPAAFSCARPPRLQRQVRETMTAMQCAGSLRRRPDSAIFFPQEFAEVYFVLPPIGKSNWQLAISCGFAFGFPVACCLWPVTSPF